MFVEVSKRNYLNRIATLSWDQQLTITFEVFILTIYSYLCCQRLSPLKLWVRVPLMARCTRYNIMY